MKFANRGKTNRKRLNLMQEKVYFFYLATRMKTVL